MANITLRQTTSATDPGSTTAKGSALTHTEADSNFILINNEVATKLANISEDTTPQLGGALDVNGQNITSASSGNIVLDPNGTGVIQLNSNVTVEDGTHDFDVASHDGTNGLKLGGTLVTSSATELNLLDGVSSLFTDLVQDTTPQLGGDLDLNGNMITDASRNFQIIGNEDNVSTLAGYFDSIDSSGARVHGNILVEEQIGNPSNRFHTNPILSYYQADAATSGGGTSAGRIRMNYVEGVYDTNGHNNTTTGFGQGFNGHFVSSYIQNKDPGNDAATVTDMTGATYTPQFESTSSGGLTVTNCKAINMLPNINSGAVNVTNLYGLYYDSINGGSGTVTNEFSFYGNKNSAPMYNAGGMQPGAFAAASVPTNLPVGTIIAISDAASRTNGTNNYQPAYTPDGTNWFYVSNDLAV